MRVIRSCNHYIISEFPSMIRSAIDDLPEWWCLSAYCSFMQYPVAIVYCGGERYQWIDRLI